MREGENLPTLLDASVNVPERRGEKAKFARTARPLHSLSRRKVRTDELKNFGESLLP